MNSTNSPYIPLDFLPPPSLSKGWDQIATEINASPAAAKRYRDELCDWLDSQAKRGWRSKTLFIDLVLPNPLDDFKTVTGILLGVSKDDLLNRHESCVMQLKKIESSVGLHSVFLRGVPNFSDDKEIKTTPSDLALLLNVSGQNDISSQHLIYGQLQQIEKPGAPAQVSRQNGEFELRAIPYSATREEQHHPLAGDSNRSLTENWNNYLKIARREVPEVACVIGIPLATPSATDDLTAEFHRIGQIFLGFSVEAYGEGGWDPDCAALIRSLCLFAAFANASQSGLQLQQVKARQVESHELGKVFNALRGKFITPKIPGWNSVADAKECVVRLGLYQTVLDHLELWSGELTEGKMQRTTVLSSPWMLSCSTFPDFVRACWEHCVDYAAIERDDGISPVLEGKDPFPLMFATYRAPLIAALVINVDPGYLSSSIRVESRELINFVKALCSLMRDVLKHAESRLRAGGKTTWTLEILQCGPDQEDPNDHKLVRIVQSNPHEIRAPKRANGKTARVVKQCLLAGNDFRRPSAASGLHADEIILRRGTLFDAITQTSSNR